MNLIQKQSIECFSFELFINTHIFFFFFYIRLWVDNYAQNQISKKIQEVVEMGFSEEQARTSLEKNGFDVERTVNYLLNM
jgi:hypothetical protein